MRWLLVLGFLLLPASVAAAGQGACDAPPAVERQRDGNVLRTGVSACGRTFARATLRERRGRAIVAAAGAPGRVAWVELERGQTSTLRAVVADTSGKRLRTVGLRRRRARALPRVPLVVSTRGDIAAIVSGRVRVEPADGPRRSRAATGTRRLVLEDDRTVAWKAGGLRLIDLPAPRTPGTCPARTGFTEVARTPEIVVTERHYEDGDGQYGTVVRACTLATGRDPAMRIASNGFDSGETLRAIGAHGPWAVMTSYDRCGDRYSDEGCRARLVVRHASGAPTRPWLIPAEAAGLQPGAPLAVTDLGAVAWVATTLAGERLVGLGGTGGFRVLDPEGPSPVTGLTTDGTTVRWRRDGVDRSAAL